MSTVIRFGAPVITLFALLLAPHPSAGQSASLQQQLDDVVTPFVQQYCAGCHSGDTPAAQLDLTSYTAIDKVVEDYAHWSTVRDRLIAADMPPAALPQPEGDERQAVIAFIEEMRADELRKRAGDPGPVLARRLSNVEYNYTIRDLTGVDIRPTREFPIDPANLAGFDNSGESLSMSPALVTKYLQAAREVADQMVLTPDGFDFAPHPMLVETDRQKYAIRRIVDFYYASPTDFADYFESAWHYKNRAALGAPQATLESIAADSGVSAKYLPMVWRMLEGEVTENVGPIAKLRRMWNDMPTPGAGAAADVQQRSVAMRDWVAKLREDTSVLFASPHVEPLSPWSQPLINWKFAQYASSRRQYDPESLREASKPAPEAPEIPDYPGLGVEVYPRVRALQLAERAGNPDLVVPDGQMERYATAFAEFSNVFPHRFYISERGRYFPDESRDKGRYLSAGYHNVAGWYRDDTALIELILNDEETAQLNRLWDEFDFIGEYTKKTYDQYFFNQSGEVRNTSYLARESGTARPEGMEVDDERVIFGLRDEYLDLWNSNPDNDAIAEEAIKVHFKAVNDTLRRMERMRDVSEPLHLDALIDFANRAYRRPVTDEEGLGIRYHYRRLREEDGLTHEEAVRDSIVAILMSPDFFYRLDLIDGFAQSSTAPSVQPEEGAARRALSPYAVASRLSYFLWSSMPDEELLAHAESGDLLERDVLLGQVRRMMTDPRVRGMTAEFAGNWLEFRHFENHNAVDRSRFPVFDDGLREAMFEEPVRLIEDAVRNDRSVLDLVYGDYTFVNPPLARHYGIPGVTGSEREWVRVDDAAKYHRGGLLPMAVFLTLKSPGLRTSPVQRGYWVVRRVLGEVIPPPPPVVPELPQDESSSDLPIRDMLIQHRENPLCSACHQRFDSFGLAFEGFGPVGERRESDLAGRLIDAVADFPDGSEREGVAGVQSYIRDERQDDYLENISRKMLAYALSRSLILSDEPIVEQAQENLAANNYRFSALIETIVTSPQFMNRRDPDPAEQRTFVPTVAQR